MKTLQDIHDLVKKQREQSFSNSQQLTLGELISELEAAKVTREDGEEKSVVFDFGTAVPTSLDSWRGSYDEIALGYELTGYDSDTNHMKSICAANLLSELKSALGKSFTGWKGGDFHMNKYTPVWVANPGNGGNTGVVGVLNDGYRIVIITAYCEY